MNPKLTDRHRFKLPYTSAEDTRKPGYLAERMQAYARLAAETKVQVRQLKKRAA